MRGLWQYAPEVVVSFLRKSGCVKQNPCPVGTYDNSPAIVDFQKSIG